MQPTKKNRAKFREEFVRTNELLEEGYMFYDGGGNFVVLDKMFFVW